MNLDKLFVDRAEWPFKDMEIGGVVTFSSDKTKASRQAHAYGRSCNPRKKFMARTDRETGILYIKRIG